MTVPIDPTENRGTVLLIGDSYGILKRIAFALQRSGHSVLWGSSVDAGLRVVERDVPDLIICETKLADGSGFNLCRTMKASFFFEMPVVLVGALSDEKQDVPQAIKAGADDYIGPFTDSQLVMAKLEWIIQKRARENQSVRSPRFISIPSMIESLN